MSTQKFTFASTHQAFEVDEAALSLLGVAVISTGEAKGHGVMVDQVTLETVMGCIPKKGVKVKVDHYSGTANIIGKAVNPRIEGDVLRADIKLLKKNPLTPQILELAQTMPEQFGLSISFEASIEDPEEDSEMPEETMPMPLVRCEELYSVDFVTEPAANKSLFEQKEKETTAMSQEQLPVTEPAAVPVVEPVVDVPAETPVELPVDPKLEAAPAESAQLEQQAPVTPLDFKALDLEKVVLQLRTDLQAKCDELSAKQAELTNLQSQLAAAVAKAQEAEKGAASRVVAELAKQGVTTALDTATADESPESLLARYNDLKRQDLRAACEFYQKHLSKLQPTWLR